MNSFYVYVLQEDKRSAQAPIKIGVSNNIERRLATIQGGNPRKVIVRVKFGPMSRASAFGLEGDLHKSLDCYRLRGEWFSGKALKKIVSETKSLFCSV